MKGKRFKEEQVIRLLQEAERGLPVANVCRKHKCSEQSCYRWKAKFGGMTVSEATPLKELERGNLESTTKIPNSVCGSKILGLTEQAI